jgi:hypothetical protein
VTSGKQYQANPDVSCREEGPEGALLFNPDTDGILVINPTGLLLWRELGRPRTQDQLVSRLVEACDGVSDGEVEDDVAGFLQTLLPGGYVGEVLEGSGF